MCLEGVSEELKVLNVVLVVIKKFPWVLSEVITEIEEVLVVTSEFLRVLEVVLVTIKTTTSVEPALAPRHPSGHEPTNCSSSI